MRDDSSTSPGRRESASLPTALATWATLLSRWTALVKAGEGLVRATPGDVDARRWRDSIPRIVSLQAVTFALGDLAAIPEIDRPLARDRADLAVTEAAGALDRIWKGEEMPEGLLEVAADARRAVELAVYAGLRWLVVAGPDPRRMPGVDLEAAGSDGTLALMQPGTLAVPGEPLAWWTERSLPSELEAMMTAEPAGFELRHGPPVQVYRELDEAGMARRDLVASLQELPRGLPLLVPICLDGASIGGFTVQTEMWAAANDRAMADGGVGTPVFGPGIESTAIEATGSAGDGGG
ncbi:MAG: hypothetical protein VX672_03895 [Planctomycetota bacterium]|nr:hypothetical protein [Planctomycetota bacterium]